MRKRRQWTERERRYMFTLAVHKGMAATDVAKSVRDRFGHAPAARHIRAMVQKVCNETGTRYPYDRKKPWRRDEVLDLARTGRFKTAAALHAEVVRTMDNPPSMHTVAGWVRESGVNLDDRKSYKYGYGPEARQLAADLYREGHSIRVIIAMVAGITGKPPCRNWVYNCAAAAGISRPRGRARQANMKPVIRDEQADERRPFLVRECELSEKRTASMIGSSRRKLWWSPETSTNPRWNPAARRRAA